MSSINNNKTLNVFKWNADISGIDENINKQDMHIREAQNVINCTTHKRNQIKKK